MGAFKDLAIVEENNKQEERTMFKITDEEGYSAKISGDLLEVAREEYEISFTKRNCCMPYDCMHHEMCGADGDDYCGTCIAQRKSEKLLMELVNDNDHNPDEMAAWWIQRQVERDINVERINFYREMRALGNEDATHWTDVEVAR